MPGKRWLLGIAAGLAVLVAIAAVIFWGGPPKHPGAPPEKLVVGTLPGALAASVWIAEAEQYFQKQDLQGTAVSFGTGRLAMQAMLKGEVDVATAAATPIVVASFTRNDFVILATITYGDGHSKIVADRTHGITKPDDLNGKVIGTFKGTTAERFLDAYLESRGVTPRRIVDIRPSEVSQVFTRGVDAVSVFEPYATELSHTLGSRDLTFSAPELYRTTFQLVTTRAYAHAHPQALIRFLKAIAQANDLILNNPSQAQAILMQKLGLPAATVKVEWSYLNFTLALRQDLMPLLEDEARWAIQRGLVQGKRPPNYLDFVDSAPLRMVKPDAVTLIQ